MVGRASGAESKRGKSPPSASHPAFSPPQPLQDNILLCIESHERQIQQERNPVSIDQKQRRQESMYRRLGEDIRIQPVAKINRVDVVAFQIAVHYRKENLEKEVHCVEQNGQEIEPGFAGHGCGGCWYVRGEKGAGRRGGVCGGEVRRSAVRSRTAVVVVMMS